MTNTRVALSKILLAAFLVAPAFAHHVSPIFDTTKTMVLKGTITNVDWRNPHSSISMNVRDDSGKITNWWVELASIATLTKAGLDKSLIDLTQSYSIEVYPAKNGGAQALGRTLTSADGISYDVDEKPMQPPPAK
jgi:hypothetical protein